MHMRNDCSATAKTLLQATSKAACKRLYALMGMTASAAGPKIHKIGKSGHMPKNIACKRSFDSIEGTNSCTDCSPLQCIEVSWKPLAIAVAVSLIV